MITDDMTYYLVISHKCIKLTGKYVMSVRIISKNIIYFAKLYKTYLHEVNYNRKGQFLVLQVQLPSKIS